MCGITGIFRFSDSKPIKFSEIKKQCDIISYRGPDDEGIFIEKDGSIGLGHRRLSIIDLSSGHQPMADVNQEIWIVFNGEIYNYKELKKELIQKGYIFKTQSDTEVIINFYKEFSEKEFYRLNGIFAFAIYDRRKKTIILARDHFGIKPLYYYISNSELIFGSEIKVILNSDSYTKEIDYSALNSFLTYRYNPSPQTLFKGIKKLNPGHFLKVKADSVSLRNYWSYKPKLLSGINENEAVEKYQVLLENAVKRQMVSDVPIGLLLSGGIDSAVLGILMQQNYYSKIKTFSIGFEGNGDYNELNDAKKTSEYIDSEHYELLIKKEEYLEFFYKSFYHLEEPIAETTIPALYYISNLASKHLKVVLAGQGADEPLAGYQRYYGEKLLSNYAPFFSIIPKVFLAKRLFRNERIKRALHAASFSSEIERFLGIYSIFNDQQKSLLLQEKIKKEIKNVDLELLEYIYKNTDELEDSLAKMLFIDTRMNLSDDLLLFGDKMSMANSLEMRVPFLDVELISFLESLPVDFKLKRRQHKYIHKVAIKKWLPDEIINRKKRGFDTPMDEWLQGNFADECKKIFNDTDSAVQLFFNIDYINNILDLHKSRRENYKRQIFSLLSFEIWYKKFFHNNFI